MSGPHIMTKLNLIRFEFGVVCVWFFGVFVRFFIHSSGEVKCFVCLSEKCVDNFPCWIFCRNLHCSCHSGSSLW